MTSLDQCVGRVTARAGHSEPYTADQRLQELRPDPEQPGLLKNPSPKLAYWILSEHPAWDTSWIGVAGLVCGCRHQSRTDLARPMGPL